MVVFVLAAPTVHRPLAVKLSVNGSRKLTVLSQVCDAQHSVGSDSLLALMPQYSSRLLSTPRQSCRNRRMVSIRMRWSGRMLQQKLFKQPLLYNKRSVATQFFLVCLRDLHHVDVALPSANIIVTHRFSDLRISARTSYPPIMRSRSLSNANLPKGLVMISAIFDPDGT